MAKEKNEQVEQLPPEIPYYGILEKRPEFPGASRYRAPLNFELDGKEFSLVFDDGTQVKISLSADTIVYHEAGSKAESAHYECAKIDELTYFVNFEFEATSEVAELKPRTNIILVLDLEQQLVTKLRTRTKFDPKYPTLCDSDYTFGAIARGGSPLNEKRHGLTRDLVGKRIHWHYAPETEIIHVYYSTDYIRATFPAKPGTPPPPPEVMEELEKYPYDEKAFYIKIKENIYLVSATEQNMSKRGLPGNSMVFLMDTARVHDVGRSFGLNTQVDNLETPENYIFGAYGDFVYSDGVIEAKKNPYI
jgi:hypothetical protein